MEDIADGGGTSKALETKPEITWAMVEYVDAFETLSSRRSGGFGPNPISLTDMLAYLQIYGASDVEEFMYHIPNMDNSYLMKQAEKRKKESNNGSSGSK